MSTITPAPLSGSDLLPQIIQAHARDRGDHVFIEQVEGGLRQTYAETHERSRQWASALRSLGVNAGDHVARFTPTCMEAINIWVGLGWLGATDVPINTGYRGAMLAAILQNSRAEVLVCAARWIDAVIEVADQLTHLKRIVVLDGPVTDSMPERFEFLSADELVGPDVSDEEFTGPAPSDIAMIVYSSGTTGVSKAAMLTWATYATGARNFAPPGDALTADDVLYLPYPLFHIAGTFWTYAIARAGATVVLREVFSSSNFWKEIRQYSCTMTHLLGATANFIFRQEERPDDADNPLRMVSMVPLLKDLRSFESRFGVQAYSVYGMTELGVVTGTMLSPTDPASCGAPFPEYELRVVDELDREVPVGELGELIVRPTQPWVISTGYFGMPDATVDAWRNLWFHTGDGFRRDEAGNYYFVDRIKDSIRRRGENISSMEVEMFVLRHPDVLECAAIPAPSEWSEDEVKVCVVAKDRRSIEPAELLEFLVGESMPRFMLPRYVEVLDQLPRTQTGKILKHALRTDHENTNGWDREATASNYQRPHNEESPWR